MYWVCWLCWWERTLENCEAPWWSLQESHAQFWCRLTPSVLAGGRFQQRRERLWWQTPARWGTRTTRRWAWDRRSWEWWGCPGWRRMPTPAGRSGIPWFYSVKRCRSQLDHGDQLMLGKMRLLWAEEGNEQQLGCQGYHDYVLQRWLRIQLSHGDEWSISLGKNEVALRA